MCGDRVQTETIEYRLACALLQWSRQPSAESRDGIAGLLEPFLSNAFSECPFPPQREWWSDGVAYLSLEQITNSHIQAVGVTYCASSDSDAQFLGPFEIDFYFDSHVSDAFTRARVRFGAIDRHDKVVQSSLDSTPYTLADRRPKRDSDWAMSIEITYQT